MADQDTLQLISDLFNNGKELSDTSETQFRIAPAFTDDRGDIINVITGLPMTHLAVITCTEGSVRGNHYHPEPQFMYLIDGEYEVTTIPLNEDGTLQHRNKYISVARRGTLSYCPPNLVHAYRFTKPSTFLNICTGEGREPKDFEQHTTRLQVL